jgi:hypothetical protein
MSTKNSWKSFGGIYKTQEITNLGIGTLVVDEVITRKKIVETLVFEQILSLNNEFIQSSGSISTYGTSKFNLNTFHNNNVFVKNKIVFAGGNEILEEDTNEDAQGALKVTVGGDFVVPNSGDAINFLYGDVTSNRLSVGTTNPTSFFHIYQPTTDTIGHSLFTIETGKTSARAELLKTNNSSGMIDISSNSSITQQRFIASNSVNGSFISTSDIFTIDNSDTNKSIHIDAYDTSINSTVNTEITSLNNTIIHSQYTQVKGKSVFTNKIDTDERLNETVMIYDNSNNSYLSGHYNVNVDDYKTGNALTISTTDASSNAFQHIITPNYKGFGIGGGAIVSDSTKSMGTMGVLIDDSSTTDSSFVPGITLYETGNKAVNRSTVYVNSFLPNTTSHSMAINGATHIGHGELHIRAYADFYIHNVSFSKQDPLYGMASGKTTSSTSPFDYYYLETKDGGANWVVKSMDNATYRVESNILLSAYPSGLRDSSDRSFLINNSLTTSTALGFLYKANNVSSGWDVNTSIANVHIKLFHVNYLEDRDEYLIIAKVNSEATNIRIDGTDYSSLNNLNTNIDLSVTGYGNHGMTNILGISGHNDSLFILGVNNNNKVIITKYNIVYQIIGGSNSSNISYKYHHNNNTTLTSGVPVIDAYSTDSVVVVGNGFITYSNNASITGATWNTLSNTGYNLTQLHLPNERNGIAFGTRISDSQPILLYSNDYYHTWQEVDDYTLNASGLKHIMTDALNSPHLSIHMSSLSTIVVSYVVSDTESRIVYGHFPYLLNKEYNSVLDVSGNMQMSGVVYQF